LWLRGGAAENYSTQGVQWIADLPVDRIAAWDSACFLWATFPRLAEAMYVLRCWGFEYRTVAFAWIKMNRGSGTPFFGMGQWTRANAEVCLLGIRGQVERRDKSVSQIIMGPVSEHSRKPDEARDRIVQLLGDLPRIELFARPLSPMWPKAEGWDVWGNEMENNVDLIGMQDSAVNPNRLA
jgi:N6-adenosine-specific RNA methylase IME4